MRQQSIKNESLEPAKLSIFSKITDWLDTEEWEYRKFEENEEQIAVTATNCSNGSYQVIIKANESLGHAYFWAVLGVKVPETQKMRAAEFITRANYGRRIGYFEMDWADGEFRINVTLVLQQEKISDEQIEESIDAICYGINEYVPSFLSVIYWDKSPAEAVEGTKQWRKKITDESIPESIPDPGIRTIQ